MCVQVFFSSLITHSCDQSAAQRCHGTEHLWREVAIWRVSVYVCVCVCVCSSMLSMCVHVSVYLWEDQYSVALIFEFPQHLLHQRQFPRGLNEGRPLVSTVWSSLSFLHTHTHTHAHKHTHTHTEQITVCISSVIFNQMLHLESTHD